MATIVVLGSALGGIQTALLLAQDGHHVTILERDLDPAPRDPDTAWSSWKRPGIPQLRQTHLMLARWRQLAETHLPLLVQELASSGAARINTLATEPALRDPLLPADERFDTLNARRPVIESAAARAASAAHIRVKYGVSHLGLVTVPGSVVPQVTGVATSSGTLPADLVIDCTGRRSQLPAWLRAIGVSAIAEESDERGFTYYSRYFRSEDGLLPSDRYSMAENHGSMTLLRVPADRGTWSLCLVTRSDDHALRALRSESVWDRAVSLFPGAQPWIGDNPLTDGVQVMAGLKNRKRNLYDPEQPIVTGFVAIGDAWASTNPTLGRGLTMSLEHAVALRDTIRAVGCADPTSLAESFAQATNKGVGRTFHHTRAYSHHRLGEMDADVSGTPYLHPEWAMQKALEIVSQRRPAALRALRTMSQLLPGVSAELQQPCPDGESSPRQPIPAPGTSGATLSVAEVVARYIPRAEGQVPPGPTRSELLKEIRTP